MIYGVDVSAYQPHFDFAACAREGYDFAIIKATEGAGWRSSYFHDQVQQARAAGLLVAAYHYVRGSDVAGQLANIKAMVAVDIPVILDVEDGAGSISSIRALNKALNDAGYHTPLIYIPRWYWSGRMGSPDLTGLPPNWHSRYPDNVVRRKEGFALGPEYWPSFGGIHTEVAQFTSSLAVANYPAGRIDGNAYRGTREQLAELFGGEEDEMSWDTPISKDPSPTDDRTAVPAGEMLKYTNQAAWLAADGVKELLGRPQPTVTLSPEDRAAIVADLKTELADEVKAIVVEGVKKGVSAMHATFAQRPNEGT